MVSDLMQVWSDPHARHALLVHFPIVLGIVGVIPAAALAFTRFKNSTLKIVVVVCYLAASAGAGLAASAGEEAEEKAERAAPALSPAEKAALHDHEELGEGGWMWPLIPAALAAATFIRRKPVPAVAGSLAIAGAVAVAVWVGLTGKAGGRLVYEYGVGVPARGQAAAPLGAPAPDED